MITHLIFDWGDTVMKDYPELTGPMYQWSHVELIEGISVVLPELSVLFTCCIASNAGASDTQDMKMALKRVDVKRYFRYFFTSKDLGVEKPDLNFFKKIIEEIKSVPEDCIMIGNSYDKDIVGAKKAGMKTILFMESITDFNFIFADIIISSIFDLPKAVEKLCLA